MTSPDIFSPEAMAAAHDLFGIDFRNAGDFDIHSELMLTPHEVVAVIDKHFADLRRELAEARAKIAGLEARCSEYRRQIAYYAAVANR